MGVVNMVTLCPGSSATTVPLAAGAAASEEEAAFDATGTTATGAGVSTGAGASVGAGAGSIVVAGVGSTAGDGAVTSGRDDLGAGRERCATAFESFGTWVSVRLSSIAEAKVVGVAWLAAVRGR